MFEPHNDGFLKNRKSIWFYLHCHRRNIFQMYGNSVQVKNRRSLGALTIIELRNTFNANRL